MVRRIILIGVVLSAALLFSMGDAAAGRLGGAYRGPYEDMQQEHEDQETEEAESSDSGSDTGTDVGRSGDGSGTQEAPGGDGDADPPPGGDEGGGGNEGPEAAGGGGSREARDRGSMDGGSGGTNPGGGALGTAGDAAAVVEDVQAFWPFYFEYNKEWILDEKLRERGSRAPISENSSVWWFRWVSGQKSRMPVTKEQKDKILLLLLESLQSKSDWTRDAAVLALGKLGGPGTVAAISTRLHDQQRDVREDALLALGLTGEEAAAEHLRRAVVSSNPEVKAFAALGLALLGRKDEASVKSLTIEYKALIRRNDKESQEVAACLAIALGALGNEETVDVLVAPLRRPKGQELLKVYICQALGRIGGENSRDWLDRALKDKSKEVKAAAILALSEFPDKRVFRVLSGVKRGHRMSKLYSLVSLGRIASRLPADDLMRKQISNELTKVAEKPQKDKYEAMFGTLALALMGDDSANKVLAEYLTPDKRDAFKHEVHSVMALAMGMLGDRRSLKDIREIALKGRLEPDYRGYAAFALGILGDSSVKEDLKEEMLDDERDELLRSGCWAIGLLGDSSDIPFLLKVLKMQGKGKHEVRGAAALAIGLIGDGSAVAPLMKIAKEDSDSENRAFAIAALGCLVDREPLPRIPRLFKNVHYRQDFPIMREALSNL